MKIFEHHIPVPCPADWNEMTGDDRSRHCESCQKSVHHLSSLTQAEAEALLDERRPEGLCVRVAFDVQGLPQFRPREVEPTAPRRQQLGVRRLLDQAGAVVALIATLTGSRALAQPHDPPAIAGGLPPLEPQPEPKPPVVTPPVVPEGSGELPPIDPATSTPEVEVEERVGEFGAELEHRGPPDSAMLERKLEKLRRAGLTLEPIVFGR